MTSKLHAISILSATETQLASQTRQFLKEVKFSGRLIFKTHPSTFINPVWLREESTDRQNALFTSVILFSLVKGHKQSQIVLAVIDASSQNAEIVASILRDYNVAVLVTNITPDFTSIQEFLHEVLVSGQFKLQTKRITNPYERWLLSTTELAIGRRLSDDFRKTIPAVGWVIKMVEERCAGQRKKLLLFHEAAISAFLALDPSRYEDVDIDWNYARKSRLDILVTGAPPEYPPLLAIEFDGPDHATEKGKLRDLKKEKILNSAGIPLLRVTFLDAPLINENDVIDLPKRLEFEGKEKLLKWLIGACVERLYRQRIEIPAKYKNNYENKVNDYLTNSIKDLRNKTRALVVDEADVMRFYDEALKKFEFDRTELDCEIFTDEMMDKHFHEEGLNPNSYKAIRDSGANLDDFQYEISESGGCYCTAKIIFQGKDRIISTPVIFFRGIGFKDFDFNKIIKDGLRWLLIQKAVSLIERNFIKT